MLQHPSPSLACFYSAKVAGFYSGVDNEQIVDGTGLLRVVFRTPNWKDFVWLTFREIRHYGAENFQIARRLRAMIDNLVQTLPVNRRPALRQELDLLDRTIEKLYIFPEDLALARCPDSQGLGGSSGVQMASSAPISLIPGMAA